MDALQWEHTSARLRVGHEIELRSNSPIYAGPYRSVIVGLTEMGLRISMPFDEGRLVLVPVGTTVYLTSADLPESVQAEVVDRRGGRDRYLDLRVVEEPPAETVAPQVPRLKGRVYAITSGKGGVGKSTFAVNLAAALAERGKRACIIDADLGTANIDVLLNLSPPFNLGDVVSGKKHMIEVIVEGPHGTLILPGGSGLRQLTRLSDEAFAELIGQFQALEEYADVILLDTGSGVLPGVTNFVAASAGALLLTTPEPHAITDAYALLKLLAEEYELVPMHLVVNRVRNAAEAELTSRRMIYAARRFLRYELRDAGFVREDGQIARAVRNQKDLFTLNGRAKAAADIRRVAEGLMEAFGWGEAEQTIAGGTGEFLQRMRSLFPKRRRDEVSKA